MGMETQTVRQRTQKRKLTLTTNATGTMSTTTKIEGEIVKLFYDRNSSLLTTVDVSVTDNDTSENIWVEDNVTDNTKTVYPITELTGTGGTVISVGTGFEYGRIYSHTVNVSLAQGGATKTGYITIFYR